MSNATPQPNTQWSRWEVLKQDTPKKPHQAVGTVHAGDAAHALLTARNVFARRPLAVSMWVVRVEDILSVTAEELEKFDWNNEAEGAEETYLVFRKKSHKQSLTFVDHIGEVEARTPKEALRHALNTFTNEPALTWWVLPERSVTRSRDEDAPKLVRARERQNV